MTNKTLERTNVDKAWERRCKNLQNATEDIQDMRSRGHGAANRGRNYRSTSQGTRDARSRIVTSNLELPKEIVSSDEVVATFRSELAAARHALGDDAKMEIPAIVERNKPLDMELRSAISNAARLRKEFGRLNADVALRASNPDTTPSNPDTVTRV